MFIKWTDEEIEQIRTQKEVCIATAYRAMERSELNFNDIERINEHYESHIWGSATDRKYRKAAINKAVLKVAQNPLKYLDEERKLK